jgi:taurine---2-oxoglutarate transaminase
VPVGGVVINDAIAATFDERVFPGGLTYSGHPLACASIVASIDAFKEEGIIENARRIGEDVLGPGLRDLQSRHKVIGEVRGLGVFWALDLVTDRATREPLAPYGGTSPAMGELVAECKKRGLLPFTNFNRLHVVPPCTVTEAEAKEGLAILDEVFAVIDRHYTGA